MLPLAALIAAAAAVLLGALGAPLADLCAWAATAALLAHFMTTPGAPA